MAKKIPTFGPYHRLYEQTDSLWQGHVGSMVYHFVETLSEGSHGLQVLDLGAGEGDVALALLNQGMTVDAVEISPVAVARIQARVATLHPTLRQRLRVRNMPVEELVLERCYNVVIAYGLLHCFADISAAAATAALCRDAITPGGTLILSSITDGIDIDCIAHPELADCYIPQVAMLNQWFAGLELVKAECDIVTESHGGPLHQHEICRRIYRSGWNNV